jgi:hypothetical protein
LKQQIRRAAVSVMSNIAEGLHPARDPGSLGEPDSAALLALCLEISRMPAALHTRTMPQP